MTDSEASIETEYLPPIHALRPIATFITSVARIERGGHPFTRVTFRGGDLAHFSPIGPDQFLYLLLPPAGRRELTIDAGFNWDQFREMPEAERPIGAYYTVRHYRPAEAEVDIEIVRHGHGGRVGAWLERAEPGDRVGLWGPRMVYDPPPGCGRLLLCGDETALPAIGAILESGPQAESVTVVVELDPHTVPPFEAGAELEVIRLDRAAGGSWQLPDAMRTQTLDADTYVWGAGEMKLMHALRRELREEAGLRAEQVALVGYWRHGTD